MIVAAPGGNLLVKCVRNTSGVVPKNHAFFFMVVSCLLRLYMQIRM